MTKPDLCYFLWLCHVPIRFSVTLHITRGHVCILKKRPDPDNGGVLTWSVLYNEVCLCQAGLRINTLLTPCTGPEEDGISDVWFIDDDPEQLAWQTNWNKDAMDRLLGRVEYCGEYSVQRYKRISLQLSFVFILQTHPIRSLHGFAKCVCERPQVDWLWPRFTG